LNQPETARLASGEAIEQTTHFTGDSRLATRVEPGSAAVCAEFNDGRLVIRLPAPAVRHWADSDEAAIEAEQPAGNDRSLKTLIEKDFQCLHSGAPAAADAFPNPAAR
jgi:hypothetical protein